jgi:hypothetical protein
MIRSLVKEPNLMRALVPARPVTFGIARRALVPSGGNRPPTFRIAEKYELASLSKEHAAGAPSGGQYSTSPIASVALHNALGRVSNHKQPQ